MRIAAIDVAYEDQTAFIGCIAFNAWTEREPVNEWLVRSIPAAYVSGRFYERELPCLLRGLEELPSLPEFLVVDGFVWLDDEQAPGLGAHAWNALNGEVTVIGVAKNPFRVMPPCSTVTRGASTKPLYVSAAGMAAAEAAELVRSMHGEHRFPTLLRRVDQLSRRVVAPCAR